MNPFKFRLQTVLRLRIADRDDKRTKLAEAYQAEQILQARIEDMTRDIDEVRERTRRGSTPGEINVDVLLQTHRYELLLTAQKKALDQQLIQVRAEVERRRETLVEADRQVRVLEKLREKRFGEYQQAEFKQEVKQLDEVALQRRRVTLNQRAQAKE